MSLILSVMRNLAFRRSLLKGFAPLAFAMVLGASASAQEDFPIRFRLGWAVTGDFELRNGRTSSMSGPELQFELPMTTISGTELALTASIFGGGRVISSGDTDGDVFRFYLTGRRVLDSKGMYASLGVGYGHTSARINSYEPVDGTVFRFAIGMPTKIGKWKNTDLEFAYTAARAGQLKGFFVGVASKF